MQFTAPLPFGTSRVPNPFLLFLPVFVEESPAKRIPPDFRFYSLSDKVWRDDVLAVAWQAVRRNAGAAGVDGETVADVESFGVDRWLEALARDLKAGTYRPQPVRQVLIPKKQRGKFRPLGIPCLRDRVAQTAAMLVLLNGK